MPETRNLKPIFAFLLLTFAFGSVVLGADEEGGARPADPAALARVQTALSVYLPSAEATPGWRLQGKPAAYLPETLYNYIDGAADTFLNFGFRRLLAANYLPPKGKGHVIVDIYDMVEPINAFGVYAIERASGDKFLQIGGGGYLGPRALAFWQGPFFVRVSSLLEASDYETPLTFFARAVSARLPQSKSPPKELGLLPTERRIANSERYYRAHFLGHEFLKHVVSAEYSLAGRAKATLFVMPEANDRLAGEHFQRLKDFYMETELHSLSGLGNAAFFVKDPHRGGVLIVRRGRYLVGVLEAELDAARNLGELVLQRLAP